MKPEPKSKSKQIENIDRIEQRRRKGLHGSPTYDKLGYELDKEYIIKHTSNRQGSGRSAWGKKAMNDFEQKRKDRKRKAEILFGKGAEDGSILVEDAWGDHVAKDLGRAFHDVGMEEYEEWKRKRFKVDAEEFEDLSKEEKERLMDLATGSAMRVGNKRR